MLQVSQIRLAPDHTPEQLEEKIRKILRLPADAEFSFGILRRSVDARKKPRIFYVYTVEVSAKGEEKILKRCRSDENVKRGERSAYRFPDCTGKQLLKYPPVIVGSGPAGLFCALMLSRQGFRPVLLERGASVEERRAAVEEFWEGGALDPDTNVQFGEGGAGTFSDGKLNTMIKDPSGRIRFVLETFVAAGADPQILISQKPHVGTDVLTDVVRTIREEILQNGGTVLFHSCLEDITEIQEGTGTAWQLKVRTNPKSSAAADGSDEDKMIGLKTEILVLAIGHSARDTFSMLYGKGMTMSPKAFAVGVRVQHPQVMINEAMYGENCPYELESASYKVTAKTETSNGEAGVYSFCMCPGGYVVNASSEDGRLAVNGMSYHDRAGENANSAIVVTVSPEQYGAKEPLDGIAFQRELEQRAYRAGGGSIPLQRYEDYCKGLPTHASGSIAPVCKGSWSWTDITGVFPEWINESIRQGMQSFSRQIPGFDDPDTILSAVESRTSSPVRIERDEQMVSLSHPGIYPCGEGAGYAGGITSAAIDGIRVAEAIVSKYNEGIIAEDLEIIV